ncbi:hypothetical protein QE152_g28523 [Popillia japonica]|uniref:Uncharacterized protein n=1 Tax=Popillia japonica TaxID=7064 RepID=A0AAW1JJX1_POPJA
MITFHHSMMLKMTELAGSDRFFDIVEDVNMLALHSIDFAPTSLPLLGDDHSIDFAPTSLPLLGDDMALYHHTSEQR